MTMTSQSKLGLHRSTLGILTKISLLPLKGLSLLSPHSQGRYFSFMDLEVLERHTFTTHSVIIFALRERLFSVWHPLGLLLSSFKVVALLTHGSRSLFLAPTHQSATSLKT